MDTEGRVLRFDSFSKIMSSGLRVGFITGPKTLLRQMELHMQTSSMHTSSLSQVLLYKLLSKWGRDGLVSHFMHVKEFYKQKRDHMMAAVVRELEGKMQATAITITTYLKIIIRNCIKLHKI
jgi:kynurenine/2-aminoadipate aminotransferase